MKPIYETEAKFIIYPQNAEFVVDEISRIRKIGTLGLSLPQSQHISDYYFDCYDDVLAQSGFALRIRKINHDFFVTLKGKSNLTDEGSVQRLEIEKQWNRQGWLEIAAYMNQQFDQLDLTTNFDQKLSPFDFLKNIGMKEIQRRKNQREQKSIFKLSRPEKNIAELAIDTTVFLVEGVKIKQYEIEIELKDDANEHVIKIIREWLNKNFGSNIKSWQYGKLATGIVIKKLWDSNEFKATIDAEGRLSSKAYQIIENLFKEQRIQAI